MHHQVENPHTDPLRLHPRSRCIHHKKDHVSSSMSDQIVLNPTQETRTDFLVEKRNRIGSQVENLSPHDETVGQTTQSPLLSQETGAIFRLILREGFSYCRKLMTRLPTDLNALECLATVLVLDSEIETWDDVICLLMRSSSLHRLRIQGHETTIIPWVCLTCHPWTRAAITSVHDDCQLDRMLCLHPLVQMAFDPAVEQYPHTYQR